MGGSRIQKAKEALVLFLKSLPEDSYFNIIGFGSTDERMFPISQRNNAENIEEAVRMVQKLSADLGGTEIYSPIKTLLS